MNRPFPSLRLACAAAVACLLAAACGSSSTSPTPTPPPMPPPALQLTCPPDQSTQSTTGQSIPVQYPSATATGGTPPTQVTCTPASGAVFNIGTTGVSCAATDSATQTASCSFKVTLTVPPKLSVTRFVAFGDSMTAGEVVSEDVGRTLSVPGQMPLKIDDAASYPTQLRSSLTGRYTGQAGAIVVANSGWPGELTADGLRRLPTVIDGGAYDALLLLEGVNDFPNYQTALGNMRSMVQYGKRRSVRVYLATVPPQDQFHTTCTPNRARNEAFVAPYNDGLHNIATSENVTFVDVFTAFHGDTTTLIDCDGLHPTPAGYKVIADTFFKAIQATLEVAPANPTALPIPTTLRIAPARRSR